jgi:hypothetical protein
MDETERQEPTEQPVPEITTCDDCGQPLKTAQGLAGHRRLKHSTSTARELDEQRRVLEGQARELTAKERAAQQREAETARAVEATRRREAEIARRERAVREAEETSEAERLRRTVEREVDALPEVTSETILRVRGTDYRISEEGRLVHLYWPKGEKTEIEEGEWFQFGGRAYRIEDGRLSEVQSATILAEVLSGED